jgi:hypothetical protein
VADLKLTYPVAVDSNRTIWNAFRNRYWPAHFFIDGQGRIRHHHFGEGEYQESERVIQQLLAENNAGASPGSNFVQVNATGAQAAPNLGAVGSPETYVGYLRQEHYASPEQIKRDDDERYTSPGRLRVNQWGLEGWWNVGEEQAVSSQPRSKIIFRFHARDLHLVLGPRSGGKPVRFRVLIDGAPPLDDAGVDVDRQGNGSVTSFRLYQLVRQKGAVEDRTFQIEFRSGRSGVRVHVRIGNPFDEVDDECRTMLALSALGGVGFLACRGKETSTVEAAETGEPKLVSIVELSISESDSASSSFRRWSRARPNGKSSCPGFPTTSHAGRTPRFRSRRDVEQPPLKAVSLHLLRYRPLQLRDQVRVRHRLAQLLGAARPQNIVEHADTSFEWFDQPSHAGAATRTSATCSTTDPSRPDFDTA